MICVSIDPGKLNLPVCAYRQHTAGWDLFYAKLSVVDAGSRVAPDALARMHLASIAALIALVRGAQVRVVVEQMQMNKGRDQTHRKAIATGNDLLAITQVASAVAVGLGGSLVWAPIGSWKGTASKLQTKNRVRATLRPDELRVLDAALGQLPRRGTRESSLAHNLYDAAGIGLWATGRYVVRRSARADLR